MVLQDEVAYLVDFVWREAMGTLATILRVPVRSVTLEKVSISCRLCLERCYGNTRGYPECSSALCYSGKGDYCENITPTEMFFCAHVSQRNLYVVLWQGVVQ